MQNDDNHINPFSPEDYAKVMSDSSLQEYHQVDLDAFFKGRIDDVNKALHELDWFGDVLSKHDHEFTYDVATVGAGTHIVGVKYELKDLKGFFVCPLIDDLTTTPKQIAEILHTFAQKNALDNGDSDDLNESPRL